MSHVDMGALHAYLDGALDEYPAADAARIREHVDQCGECAKRLEAERRVRADAQAILGMATPNVEMPSLEELRAYVKRTRTPRPATAVRIYRMGWAASVVLAVGAGWMLRGGQLQEAGLVNGDFRLSAPSSEAPSRANDPDQSVEQVQDVLSESGQFREGSSLGASSVGADLREDAPAPVLTRAELEAPAREGARVASEELQLRDDVSENLVAKATPEMALALEEIVVTGVTAPAPPSSEQDAVRDAAAGAGAPAADEPGVAGGFADLDAVGRPVDELTAVVEAATLDGRLDDSVASAAGAGDEVPVEPEEDEAIDRAERRRVESPTAVTSELNRSTSANQRQAGDEEPIVSDEPRLVVEGYFVVDIVNLGEGTTPLGAHVIQRLDDETTFESYHLEVDVDPSVLPALPEGHSEVSVQTGTGWIIMRGPLTEAELDALLAQLFPDPEGGTSS